MNIWLTNLPIGRRLFVTLSLMVLCACSAVLVTTMLSLQTLSVNAPEASGPRLLIVVVNSVTILLLLLLTALLGGVIHLSITRPLIDLAELAGRIEQGDLHAHTQVRGYDEIGVVAASMNRLIETIVGRHEALQAQIETLVVQVKGVKEGDLRVRAQMAGGDLGMLAAFFNSVVEALSNLIRRVKRMTEEVKDATANTQQHLGKLVQIATRQIEQMQHASSEVGAVTHASRQVAEYAARLEQAAHHARQIVLEGRERVQETSEGMARLLSYVQTTAKYVDHLGKSSQEIGEITEVLTHLVHTTQRLALDASIQAVMAGDAGKGFGAVAEDIRRLADKAKVEATRITRIVSSVLQEISMVTSSMQATYEETTKGDRYIAGTGKLLENMFTLVDQQAEEIERIHALCQEQLSSCEACVHMIAEVSTATQQSSVSIQEVSSNMNTLLTRSSILQQIVNTFQLAEYPAVEELNSAQVRRSTERFR